MTAEERRIAILEFLGWTKLSRAGRRGEDGPVQALRGIPPGGSNALIAPNHPASLRLMHELERDHLDSKEAGDYDSWLWIILKHDWEAAGNNQAHITTWHATPMQKSRAFLHVKGLWKRSNADSDEKKANDDIPDELPEESL